MIINRNTKKWLYLSHPLSTRTPAYGGEESLKVDHIKNMMNGDSCNKSYWMLSNHLGTHIDFPRHFSHNGKTACEYPAEFWIFHTPYLMDISPIDPRVIIDPHDINGIDIPENVDLLLLKTNFVKRRSKQAYWKENPGIHPSMAFFLRNNFKKLKVLGFDFISLTSFSHRELGRNAHREFLDQSNPILILEDVDLSKVSNKTKIEAVIISPLIIKQSDAAPCTVFAQLSE